ncbi:hypothetical protein H0Z60_01560 [Ectothiorhodospiraceae bacterium WFHF3C12]|nr:hypothetical protein [Ectothiorhodospiraceae bacterium WFHF3C12]
MRQTKQHTDELVAALSRPGSYPERTGSVGVRETHMSWVFLTDSHAYKLKKPLHYSYLDFRSADARRLNCEREVRLNRRFTTGVYQGVAAVRLATAGRAVIGPPTPSAADWLVVMRRLDERETLEARLADGTVTADDLAGPMALLLRGYDCRPRPSIPAFEYVNRLWRSAGGDASELCRPLFGLDARVVEAIRRDIHHYLARNADVVAGRVRRKCLVEGHGDLRPEHVYLGETPRIVDCLEFDRRLRLLDPVDELSCLGLHSERLGGAWVPGTLLEHYVDQTGDQPPAGLAALYTACRGLLWAKLAIWHLERSPTDGRRWQEKAEHYLSIAAREARAAAATA